MATNTRHQAILNNIHCPKTSKLLEKGVEVIFTILYTALYNLFILI